VRRESKSEREAWTAHIEGREAEKESKYKSVRTGKYASKLEAMIAARLDALHRAGIIKDLQEQVRIVLVEGRGKLRPIVWVADFVYTDDDGIVHYLDAKGYKTQIYRLKKRLAALLKGIEIEEV